MSEVICLGDSFIIHDTRHISYGDTSLAGSVSSLTIVLYPLVSLITWRVVPLGDLGSVKPDAGLRTAAACGRADPPALTALVGVLLSDMKTLGRSGQELAVASAAAAGFFRIGWRDLVRCFQRSKQP